MKALIFGLVFCWSSLAFSEEQKIKIETMDPVTITPDSRLYPEGASENGVQGIVLLKSELSSEGRFKNVTLYQSSRSEELDKAAMELSAKLKFTLSNDTVAGMPAFVIAPIDFRKDTLKSIPKKNCIEFNQDAAYFKKTFPEKQLSEMGVFKLSAGIIALSIESKKRVVFAVNLNKIREETIEECAKSPESKFLNVMIEITAKKL